MRTLISRLGEEDGRWRTLESVELSSLEIASFVVFSFPTVNSTLLLSSSQNIDLLPKMARSPQDAAYVEMKLVLNQRRRNTRNEADHLLLPSLFLPSLPSPSPPDRLARRPSLSLSTAYEPSRIRSADFLCGFLSLAPSLSSSSPPTHTPSSSFLPSLPPFEAISFYNIPRPQQSFHVAPYFQPNLSHSPYPQNFDRQVSFSRPSPCIRIRPSD